MIFEGRHIMESRGRPSLAEMIRNSSGRAQNQPLVRLTLPNQLTIGRHRLIRQVVEASGGQHITVPARVLANSDLVISTIQVVDSADSKVPFRAQEQLIKGTVRVRLGVATDWMRGTYRNQLYDITLTTEDGRAVLVYRPRTGLGRAKRVEVVRHGDNSVIAVTPTSDGFQVFSLVGEDESGRARFLHNGSAAYRITPPR